MNKCLLVREYEVYAHNIHHVIANSLIYERNHTTGLSATELGYHPNRYTYLIPDTNPYFTWLILQGIGHIHYYPDSSFPL